MNKILEQTFHQNRYTYGKYAMEKILILITY